MHRYCIENKEGGPESRTLIRAQSPSAALYHYARKRLPALGLFDRCSKDPEGGPDDWLVTGTSGRSYALTVTRRQEEP